MEFFGSFFGSEKEKDVVFETRYFRVLLGTVLDATTTAFSQSWFGMLETDV